MPQDFTGLRAEPALLPVRNEQATAFEDFVEIGESYNLRGFAFNVIGDSALMTTLEWRLPLTGALPVSAFGFSTGGLTGVLYHDHGRVWLDGDEIEARHTVGWELRLPLRFGGSALLVPSFGEGQSLDWENENATLYRDEYFRLAFTQGF